PAVSGSTGSGRPVALVTGVGRTAGIGAGIAERLAAAGWDIAFTYWTAYDRRMPWGAEAGAAGAIRPPWTASPSPPRASWRTWASPPTRSTRDPWTTAG
ncbi:MAG TPA: hypothetical protein VFV41_03540, partial [Streptosporangiaceae bacterium]|nr:hypothetical protein [Streptosporangiaceae bacterium]